MVMIPVGNRTMHCFRLWCFVETYIRSLITAVVLHKAKEALISSNSFLFLIILFFIWSCRPIYLELKGLYNSWKWAKHKAESEANEEEVPNLNQEGTK